MTALAWSVRLFSSLRARLLLLVLLTLAAPVGVLLRQAAVERSEGLARAQADAMQWAHIAALEHQQRLDAAHQFLEVLTELPQVVGKDAEACNRLAGHLLQTYALYANLSAALPDGRVFCSGAQAVPDESWAQQGWFQQARNAGDMVVGDYQLDPIARGPVLTLAHPVRDDAGTLQAVVAVLLPLDWLAGYAMGSPAYPDRSLEILDETGSISLRYPEPERWIGEQHTVEAFVRAIRDTPEAGNVEGIGLNGARQLFAYSRLTQAPQGEQRYLLVGLPASVAYAASQRQLHQDLALLGTSAAIAVLAAWWVGGLLVLRPLGSLLQATGALRQGDLTVRTGPPYPLGELGQLAQAFDNMAATLAAREAQRQQAEAEVRALNADLERRVAERTEQLEAVNRTLARYADEQATLYGVSAAIAGTLEPRELLSSVLDIALEALGADAGWVLVADRVIGPHRGVAAWKGVPEEFVRAEAEVPPETCPACELLSKTGAPCGEPQAMSNCSRLSPAVLSATGLNCHVTLPLVSADRVLGTLNVGWRVPHTLSPAESALLETIGRQLRVAVEKAELYTAATRRARRLAVINGIGQALTATLDLDCVLDTLLASVTPAIEADAAGVALAEEAEDTGADEANGGDGRLAGHEKSGFVYRRAAGPGSPAVIGCRTGEAGSLAAHVLATRSPARRQAADDCEAAAWRGGRLQGSDVVCLPLLAGERMIGILEVAKGKAEELDSEDLQLLNAVAAQAAVAIENALLYQRQRAQYRRLEESQAQLVRAEKSAALGGLAAALAHEINNPLQSLRGHIEMVTDFPLQEQERSRYLQIAREEILRLSEITQRILNFYRPARLVRVPIQVNELVEQTLLLAGKQLERARISVGLELSNSRLVMGVPGQLVQVFLNVLINAVEAIEESGHIAITTSADAENVIISFANNGPPIAPDNLLRIFTANFTTKLSGTGLGLFVAQNILHQHGGTIVARNVEDEKGVVFIIYLPAANANQGDNR